RGRPKRNVCDSITQVAGDSLALAPFCAGHANPITPLFVTPGQPHGPVVALGNQHCDARPAEVPDATVVRPRRWPDACAYGSVSLGAALCRVVGGGSNASR